MMFLFLMLIGYAIPLKAQVTWQSGTSYNFEKVHLGEERVTIFTFLNSGTKPLVIDNVRTTCGCTAPEWDNTPVLPGESGVIRIEFRPNRKGITEKHIKVWFKDLRKPHSLKIEAEVY
ncbi:MAG: DUF1573 domain-containing protein [Saprospiraceae bacterium]|jgi:hypothetical protein|nr:DUF1573 domain-containing protein [Saprospiraceae bacterium]